jgi:hypothetical protein
MAFVGNTQFFTGIRSEQALLDAASMEEMRPKDYLVEVEPDVFTKVRIAKVNQAAAVVRVAFAQKGEEEVVGEALLTPDQQVFLADGKITTVGQLKVGQVLMGSVWGVGDPEAKLPKASWKVTHLEPQAQEVPVYAPIYEEIKVMASQYLVLAFEYN